MLDPRATAQLKTCPYCESPIVEGNRFCLQCGNPLTSDDVVIVAENEARASVEPLVGAVPTMGVASTPAPVVVAAPPAATEAQWRKTSVRPLGLLSTRVDSWGEVVDDKGELAAALQERFKQAVTQRQMPGVNYEITSYISHKIGSREYLVVRSPRRGGRVAVYINQFGRDLYLAWDLWVSFQINWIVIAPILGLSVLCGPLFSWLVALSRMFTAGNNVIVSLGWPVLLFAINVIILGAIVGWAGRFLRRDWRSFFLTDLDDFDIQDLRAILLATHDSLLQAANSVGIEEDQLRKKDKFGGEKLGGVI
ncbi:MAG: zinc ribbon domain-containing protein [Chloroflexales bacterium]|nr:zinc ribbon domain-containing protein [Chloroflexales bacterium]